MKQALINLLKVKSLMTICVMIVFTILALKSKIPNELISSVITAIITYYFTKKESDNDDESR